MMTRNEGDDLNDALGIDGPEDLFRDVLRHGPEAIGRGEGPAEMPDDEEARAGFERMLEDPDLATAVRVVTEIAELVPAQLDGLAALLIGVPDIVSELGDRIEVELPDDPARMRRKAKLARAAGEQVPFVCLLALEAIFREACARERQE